MKDVGEAIQAIIAEHYSVYRDQVVESVLTDLRNLEQTMLDAHIACCRDATAQEHIETFVQSVYPVRVIERAVNLRRRSMERLALDGPGDWISG